MRSLKRMRARMLEMLGYDRLGSAFARYLAVYAAFTVASTLSGTYFSVYLLRATGSETALLRYTLLVGGAQPFVMFASTYALKHGSVRLCLRVGLALHAAAYALLAAAPGAQKGLIYFLSALFASGNAFYFTSYTPLILACTRDDTRDAAYGAMGLTSTAFSLVLPLLTGFFISSFGDLAGYRPIFLCSCAVLALGFLLSFRLMPGAGGANARATCFLPVARRMAKSGAMRRALLIALVQASRAPVLACYAPLLMYALLRREAVMGVLTAVSTIVGLLANFAYGRLLNPARRGKSMLLGVLVMFTGALALYVFRTPAGYAAFALFSALSAVFLDTPALTSYISAVQRDDVLRDQGAEVHTLREFFVASGRAAGLLPAFLLPNTSDMAAMMILVLTALQGVSAWLARPAQE